MAAKTPSSPPAPARPSAWPLWVAAVLGAATVALAEPAPVELNEVLEGFAGGSAGMPWLRLRALVLTLGTWVPIGTVALRLAFAVALVQAALAAWIARRTWLAHAGAHRGPLLGGCGILAGALAVSFPASLEAVRAPSAASLGVVVLLVALEAEAAAAAFAAGLLLALDPVLFFVGIGPLWFRHRTIPLRSLRALWLPLAAGACPLLLVLVPGRAAYTLEATVPIGWASFRAALGALGQVGWAAAAVGAVGLGLMLRRGGALRGVAIERLALLVLAALAAIVTGPLLGRSALVLASVIVAESVASSVWLGGLLLSARRIPLARVSVGFVLLLLLAWPLSRLDAAVGHPTDARVARAAVELPLSSSLPERSIMLLRDDEAEAAALGAQACGLLSASIDLLPLRHIESARAREALRNDPVLLPIARETLLGGAPSELVLSNLASLRPTFLEVTPAVPRPIAKHLLPAGAWFRFDVEPRGASDRALALDRDRRAREFAAGHVGAAPAGGRRLVRAMRRLAVALAATGEKESAARGVDALRAVAGDEPLVSILVRKSVLQGTAADLGDIVIEE